MVRGDDLRASLEETKSSPLSPETSSLSSLQNQNYRPHFTFFLPQPQWVEDISLILGRIFSLIALILVVFWAHGSNIEEGYLGGLNHYTNVFSFHPVMMISSFFFTGCSITAYRIKSLSFKYQKYLHLVAHVLAKICLTIGLRAVYVSKRDKDAGYQYHLLSLHTWLGTLTAILLIQNDIFGAITFLFPYFSRQIQKIYRPYHIFFGKMAFIFVVITIETGIMEKNTYLHCSPAAAKVDNSPGGHYNVIPPGCRLSSGLGIVIALAMIFLIFALRNQRSNRDYEHRESGSIGGLSLSYVASSGGESEVPTNASVVTPLPSASSSLSKRSISTA